MDFFHAFSLIHQKKNKKQKKNCQLSLGVCLVLHLTFYKSVFVYVAFFHKTAFGRKWCYKKFTYSSICKHQRFIYSVVNCLYINWRLFLKQAGTKTNEQL